MQDQPDAAAGSNSGQAEADELRRIERRRLRALVDANIEEASTLHAEDFQLITPSGVSLSKHDYLAKVASGALDYRVWEPGEIAVRLYGEVAAIRYRSELEVVDDGELFSRQPYWHTDLYERGDGAWRVVWSHATQVET
jgi:hypothetical protein